MHESAIIRDLMARVENEIDGTQEKVVTLRFRVGALSGIGPGSIEQGARHYALETWGYEPDVDVEQSADHTDPNALGVMLVSIGLGS
jgi:Zn finger protein HypA/HybF involved in hydrogenase expression